MVKNRSRQKTDSKKKLPSTLVRARGIDELAQRLLQVETELNANIPTTLWISDLHGEGDRFKSILRGRFGVLYQTCREALPNTFSTDKVQYLVRIIRQQQYIVDDTIKMDTQDVILCLVQILKYKLTKNFEDLIYYNPKIDEYIKNIITKKNDPYTVSEEIFKKFVHMGEKV